MTNVTSVHSLERKARHTPQNYSLHGDSVFVIQFVRQISTVKSTYVNRPNKNSILSCDFYNFQTQWIQSMNHPCTNKTYHIAGNFWGRKLSQIGEKYDFSEENFRGLLTFAAPKVPHLQILQRKLSHITTKPQNSRKFSPSKVSCYMVCYILACTWYLECSLNDGVAGQLGFESLTPLPIIITAERTINTTLK